ncbi:MAG: hypothetical protein ACPH57_07225 [Flavobacteriaceae bacterium]|jgi:hypothetical protein
MIQSTNACINCENLTAEINCSVHNLTTELDNVCDDHNFKRTITKNSTCNNCNHYKAVTCPNPTSASDGMLCFSWS